MEQNFDFYYEEGYDDPPEVSRRIFFHVVYAYKGKVRSVSAAVDSVAVAVERAEVKCTGLIWDDHRIQPLFHGRHYKLQP